MNDDQLNGFVFICSIVFNTLFAFTFLLWCVYFLVDIHCHRIDTHNTSCLHCQNACVLLFFFSSVETFIQSESEVIEHFLKSNELYRTNNEHVLCKHIKRTKDNEILMFSICYVIIQSMCVHLNSCCI